VKRADYKIADRRCALDELEATFESAPSSCDCARCDARGGKSWELFNRIWKPRYAARPIH
jgi:hypothetical protein